MRTHLLFATLLILISDSFSSAAIKRLNFVGEFDITEPALVSALGSTLSYEGYMQFDDSVTPAVIRDSSDRPGSGRVLALYPYERFSVSLAGQTLSVPGDAPGEIQHTFDNAIEISDYTSVTFPFPDTVSFRAGVDSAFGQDLLINGTTLSNVNFYVGARDLTTEYSGTDLSLFETFTDRSNQNFNLHFTLDGQQLSLRNGEESGYTFVTVPEPSGLGLVAGLAILSLRGWQRQRRFS